MPTARRLGPTQRSVLQAVSDADSPLTVAEVAARIGRTTSSAYCAIRSLASRGLIVSWVIGRGRYDPRYVAPVGTTVPDDATPNILARSGAPELLKRARPISDAPRRMRLITLGQAVVRTNAEHRSVTRAILGGELPAYRGPAGPKATRDAIWLDTYDVDRRADRRRAIARRGEWRAVVVSNGEARIPAWVLGAADGDRVEYYAEGDEIRVRRSAGPALVPTSPRVAPELRAKAVRRVVGGGESLESVGRELGASGRAIGLWVIEEYGRTLTELRAESADASS